MTEPEFTVDIQFTPNGISASAYSEGELILEDESWYTWDEVEEMKSNEESHITFELGDER